MDNHLEMNQGQGMVYFEPLHKIANTRTRSAHFLQDVDGMT
jgi:hypothetical protein